MRFVEYLVEREFKFVVQIEGLGQYDDSDHSGYFSGGQGNLIVNSRKAMRYPSEHDAMNAAAQAVKQLHAVLHDEEHPETLSFERGFEIVTSDDGKEAFKVSIRGI